MATDIDRELVAFLHPRKLELREFIDRERGQQGQPLLIGPKWKSLDFVEHQLASME